MNIMNEKTITPVAYIRTDFKEKFGIPRQSGRSPSAIGEIVPTKPYNGADFFRRIDGFSHIWLIFGFSACGKQKLSATVRPPRLGGNERVGVFASRSPFRPNGLGLSCVKLESVSEKDGEISLIVSGADLLDGTPIYDIKPYIPSADAKTNAVGGYADDFTSHKLSVSIADDIACKLPQDKLKTLIECLADDPRPSYQQDGRVYGMSFAGLEIKFAVAGDVLTVISADDPCKDK